MNRRPSGSRRPRTSPRRARAAQSGHVGELRRRLAHAMAELELSRKKESWLQSALATQRHARQMLEASLSSTYEETIKRIREAVAAVVPPGATVVVVSKGDDELVSHAGRLGWHFPRNEDGQYAGHYPADSEGAIQQLQNLIENGAGYLCFPNTAFWWLEHYRELNQWLTGVHTPVWRDERCAIYKLSPTTMRLRASAEPAAQAGKPGSALLGTTMPLAGGEGTPREVNPTLPDVFCFPIIDWDFRFQRPQQLMRQFAAAGYRVFYLSNHFRKAGAAYTLRERESGLWELSLRGPRFRPHDSLLDFAHCEALAESLSAVRYDLQTGKALAMVQSPFWWPLARRAVVEFAWPVVYDCMDHYAGFSGSNPVLVEQERELLRCADVVVASSSVLESNARRHNRNVLLVRNGCDYEHFATVPRQPARSRPVIGYYGAISEWFDAELVAEVAQDSPDWDFILVGSTVGADLGRLTRLPNVTLAGEKPYAEIPAWLAKFDVVILPFKRTMLTEAVNPVKAYEILAAGKPLISVPLPEVVALGALARFASTAREFRRQIELELATPNVRAWSRRRSFAREHTWRKRFESLLPALSAAMRRPLIQARITLPSIQNRAVGVA